VAKGNGVAAGAVPTEKKSSQSGAGWSDCSGIPPSTCEAANAAPQVTPQETRFRQLPGSDLLRELLHFLLKEEEVAIHHVQRPGRSKAAPRQAPGRRTSIYYSWLSPASLGTGAVPHVKRRHARYADFRRTASGSSVSQFGARESGPADVQVARSSLNGTGRSC
jgi:hypothetical protein